MFSFFSGRKAIAFDMLVKMVIALIIMVLIILLATGKFRQLGSSDQCIAQGGKCVDVDEDCPFDHYVAPFQCKVAKDAPAKKCCMKR